jgi:hypothetical protein
MTDILFRIKWYLANNPGFGLLAEAAREIERQRRVITQISQSLHAKATVPKDNKSRLKARIKLKAKKLPRLLEE